MAIARGHALDRLFGNAFTLGLPLTNFVERRGHVREHPLLDILIDLYNWKTSN